MKDLVELFLLDGAENLLLGYAVPSKVSIGDVVNVDGEFFEVNKKFPIYIQLYSDELDFITKMYEDITGREIYHIEDFYHKSTTKEDEHIEND